MAYAPATQGEFARDIAALTACHPGLSGIYLLDDARTSFAARVQLARQAGRTLDLQYYIWSGDRSGTMLLDELRDAARRGVRVRLLLDDHGTSGLDPQLSALAAMPNVQIRLYNPFVWRRFKMLCFLFDFARLNRRMHNKCFIVDRVVAIVGGRNIGDTYFGASDGALLADLDVVTIGAVADDIAASFDDYWQSPLAVPFAQLVRAPSRAVVGGRGPSMARPPDDAATIGYRAAIDRLMVVEQMRHGAPDLVWATARLVVDDPVKSEGKSADDQLLSHRLRLILGEPKREVRLASAYFVPGWPLVDELVRMARAGVDVRVLTNGAGATDVGLVFAYYTKYRRALIDGGVRLFEFRSAPKSDDRSRHGLRKSVKAIGKSSPSASLGASSLHAKAFTIDGEKLFVGSFNFDPRSFDLNTELGVVIDSPDLTRFANRRLERQMPEMSLEVRSAPSGRLSWCDRSGGMQRATTVEPGMTPMIRAAIGLLKRLPLERLM